MYFYLIQFENNYIFIMFIIKNKPIVALNKLLFLIVFLEFILCFHSLEK